MLFVSIFVLGKKSLASFERIGQAQVTDGRAYRKTTSCSYPEVHADSFKSAVSDSIKKNENGRGEPGSPETTFTKTCKRA